MLSVLSGCAAEKHRAQISHERGIVLEDVPFFPQKENQCGPAALAMVLGDSEVDVGPDDLVAQTYLPGRRGSLQIELAAACRRLGRIPYTLNPDISSIIDELHAGRPVLVLQNLGLNVLPVYHYAVVIGVLPPDRIVLHSGEKKRAVVDTDRFFAALERAGLWAMVVLSPGELPVNPEKERYLAAVSAFESHGNYEQGIHAYRAALTAWPNDQTALFALANNYLFREKYRQAEEIYKNILTINPGHIPAANNLAETLVKRGCSSQALAVINRLAAFPGVENSPFREAVVQTRREILQKQSGAEQSSNRNCEQ